MYLNSFNGFNGSADSLSNPYTSRQPGSKKQNNVAVLLALFTGLLFFLFGVFANSSILIFVLLLIVIIGAVIAVFQIKKKGRSRGGAGRVVQAGHLCDDAGHESEDANSALALSDMQDGYSTFSTTDSGRQQAASYAARHDYIYKRIEKMSPEDFSKKMDELGSLLDSGMIGREEYNAKRHEYAQNTR
ncbi:MAG: SHOCT domain-containing protein [Oscillospiraceae bacterium]